VGFGPQVLYSNFVTSIDGVAALGDGTSSGTVISGKHQGDRFLMALLRACAEAVVLGAGTLRASPGHLWTPAHVYPHLADSFAALRRSLGLSPEPRLVVLTASGEVDMTHPAIERGATIITTGAGARTLENNLPATCELVVMGDSGPLDLAQALNELRDRGLSVLLTEGGPRLMGQLVKQRLVDEAFITISPVVAGRGDESRMGMVAGAEFLPGNGRWSRLLTVHRHADFVFLRYALRSSERP
jgi:riboflavin biosynthesis pyrimidine reductase